MYGNASLLVLCFLRLSRGRVSHFVTVICIKCTAIHNAHIQVPLVFAHLGGIEGIM